MVFLEKVLDFRKEFQVCLFKKKFQEGAYGFLEKVLDFRKEFQVSLGDNLWFF